MTPHQLTCTVLAAARVGYSEDTEGTEAGGFRPHPTQKVKSSLESPNGATELIQKEVVWLMPRSVSVTPSTLPLLLCGEAGS